MNEQKKSIFSNHEIMCRALKDSFIKLNPRTQIKNPVMFMVFVSAILTFVMFLFSLAGIRDAAPGYILAISVILWFTVLFGNFAEAIAEGRGKAQADALRAGRKDTMASRIPSADRKSEAVRVKSTELKKGDLVYIKAGDESAITGESAPVIRESGGDRSAVTGGTTVISDWIVVRVSSNPGEGFMDKMIAMVEGASRKKTPNELALQIFLVALSIIFVLVTMSLYSYSVFSSVEAGAANPTSITNLVALLICLAPTTIGALLSAIGIAGMSRLNQANVLAMSGRAIEAAGDVETPEGRSIVVLAKERFGIRARNMEELQASFVPFTAKTRMSGIDYNGNEIRKGAADAIKAYVDRHGGAFSRECEDIVKRIANQGGTPLVVAKNGRVMGVVELKDIVKQGVKEKFADLRKMGIRTIMRPVWTIFWQRQPRRPN